MTREHQTPEEWAAEMMDIQERAARARQLREKNPDELAHLTLVDIDAVLRAVEATE